MTSYNHQRTKIQQFQLRIFVCKEGKTLIQASRYDESLTVAKEDEERVLAKEVKTTRGSSCHPKRWKGAALRKLIAFSKGCTNA